MLFSYVQIQASILTFNLGNLVLQTMFCLTECPPASGMTQADVSRVNTIPKKAIHFTNCTGFTATPMAIMSTAKQIMSDN